MKIIKLNAENFKRLKAVEIQPDGSVVIVRGRNAQGKSSVLDAIWAALGGKDACPGKPIRDGENRAEITLDLGEYVVTRVFTEKDSYLTVKNADGAKVSNPQALLDGLIGSISFDPLTFARMKPAEQSKQLSQIAGVDLESLNEERKEHYDSRTEVNREIKTLSANVESAKAEVRPYCGDTTYLSELSVSDAKEQLQIAQRAHDAHAQRQREFAALVTDEYNLLGEIEGLEQLLITKKAGLLVVQKNKAAYNLDEEAKLLPNISEAFDKFENIGKHNTIVQKVNSYFALAKKLEDSRACADSLTAKIETIDAEKAALIANADLPVNGLSFDEEGVTYKGVPFDQCSSSEQLKVSTALAMRLNPKLRVIRITDGSLLDSESMDTLQKIANSEDFQVWIEVVNDSADGPGVLIEDGAVVNQ